MKPRVGLTLGDACCYALLRLFMSAADMLIRPARMSLYRDGMGMPLTTMGMLVAVAKSIDFIWGFSVGYLSDHTKTRFGRRKPWIVLCGPLWILSLVALANPPSTLGARASASAAPICEPLESETAESCPLLEACVHAAVANGSLPAADALVLSEVQGGPQAGGGLAVYFVVFYFLFYAGGWSATMIPYDSLGMELTEDGEERTLLFGMKGAFSIGGVLFQICLGIGVSFAFRGDVAGQVGSQSIPIAVVGLLGVLLIMCKVKERHELAPTSEDPMPAVGRVLGILNNRPYVLYICMKVPLAIAGLLPANWLGDWLRYARGMEDWNLNYLITVGIVLIATLVWTPILMRCSKRFGRPRTLAGLSFAAGSFMLGAMLIPPKALPIQVVWGLGVIIALGQAGLFVVPDAILADIIDYAELTSSVRSEGLYCVLETNCQQLVETVGGVVPQLILAAVAFRNNGGCECGCNVKCENQPFLRWKCAGDIGYACAGMGSHLMFGDANRPPPCVEQNDSSVLVIRIFFLALPAFCFYCVGVVALMIPITNAKHQEIRRAIAERQRGERVWDPLTGCEVLIPKIPDEPSARRMLSFTAFERGMLLHRGLLAMRAKVFLQFLLWCLLFAAALGLCLAPFEEPDTKSSAVACGSILCAALLVLVPWDGVRMGRSLKLREEPAQQGARALEQHRASVRRSRLTREEDQAADRAAREARKCVMSNYAEQKAEVVMSEETLASDERDHTPHLEAQSMFRCGASSQKAEVSATPRSEERALRAPEPAETEAQAMLPAEI